MAQPETGRKKVPWSSTTRCEPPSRPARTPGNRCRTKSSTGSSTMPLRSERRQPPGLARGGGAGRGRPRHARGSRGPCREALHGPDRGRAEPLELGGAGRRRAGGDRAYRTPEPPHRDVPGSVRGARGLRRSSARRVHRPVPGAGRGHQRRLHLSLRLEPPDGRPARRIRRHHHHPRDSHRKGRSRTCSACRRTWRSGAARWSRSAAR